MGLAAAGLGQYPYGGASRITQYLAPSICLLTGLGVAVLLERTLSPASRRRGTGLAVGLLAALGVCLIARDLVLPYRVPADATSRSFAHWLWNESSPDAELVCAKSDLGFAFQPELWKRGMSAVYLFHQGRSKHRDRIGSRIKPLSLQSMSQPIRIVFFDMLPWGNPEFERWYSRIRSCYRIGETREFVVSAGKPDELWLRERYVLLQLEPIPTPIERRSSEANLTADSANAMAESGFGKVAGPSFGSIRE
jgi:hypothetical protein